MAGYEEWAGWLKEGLFYSYREQDERHYFNVLYRDWAHFEYTWEEDVAAGGFSGPVTINDLETTKENQIWQVIFGLNKDVNIYVHLKLYRRVLRHRPLTLVPLRAPAKGV